MVGPGRRTRCPKCAAVPTPRRAPRARIRRERRGQTLHRLRVRHAAASRGAAARAGARGTAPARTRARSGRASRRPAARRACRCRGCAGGRARRRSPRPSPTGALAVEHLERRRQSFGPGSGARIRARAPTPVRGPESVQSTSMWSVNASWLPRSSRKAKTASRGCSTRTETVIGRIGTLPGSEVVTTCRNSCGRLCDVVSHVPHGYRRADARQRIVAAAERLLRDRRFRDLTVEDVMAEAGARADGLLPPLRRAAGRRASACSTSCWPRSSPLARATSRATARRCAASSRSRSARSASTGRCLRRARRRRAATHDAVERAPTATWLDDTVDVSAELIRRGVERGHTPPLPVADVARALTAHERHLPARPRRRATRRSTRRPRSTALWTVWSRTTCAGLGEALADRRRRRLGASTGVEMRREATRSPGSSRLRSGSYLSLKARMRSSYCDVSRE